ncbi:MAG: SDR family oxidoreductase [Ktedonobacteraceae bacterium]
MFTNKVVVVTGASRGIGKAIAQDFAQQGAKVVLVAQQLAALEELEDALLATGADVMAVPTDLTDAAAVQTLYHEVQQNYGPIDILVNNAAVAVLKPIVQVTAEEWQQMTAVNLHAMFQLTQLFLPAMIERRSGVIINMSAALARNGFPNLAVYSATKAGVIAFTEAIAKEVRRYGVQAYAICPHGVHTDLYQRLFGATDPAKLITPERVAAEVVKVAAGEGGIRSGQTLDISL